MPPKEDQQEDFIDFEDLGIDDESETLCYLYEIVAGNRESVASYKGTIPDTDSIGRLYGGGSYILVVSYKDKTGAKKSKTKSFKISQKYDRQEPQQPQNFSHANSSGDLSQIVGMFTALMDRMAQQAANPVIPNLGGLIENIFGKATSVLEDNLKKQSTAINGLIKNYPQPQTHHYKPLRQITEQPNYEDYEDEEEEEEDMKNPMVSMAWQMVKGYIPNLIAGNIPQQTIDMLKANPLYQTITGSPQAKKEFEVLILENFDYHTLSAIKTILDF